MNKMIYSLLFIVGAVLTITGYQQTGPFGLMVMMFGLGMFIVLLWIYNRNYR